MSQFRDGHIGQCFDRLRDARWPIQAIRLPLEDGSTLSLALKTVIFQVPLKERRSALGRGVYGLI